MRLLPFLSLLFFFPSSDSFSLQQASSQIEMLPAPQVLEQKSDLVPLCEARLELHAPAAYQDEDMRAAQTLANELEKRCGHAFAVLPHDESTTAYRIVLKESGEAASLPGTQEVAGELSREAYQIHSDEHQILLSARSSAGLDYAVQTLRQWIQKNAQSDHRIPAIDIKDYPASAYRGLMIDTSHGARPTLDSVFRLLDSMERWKLNQLYLYAETNLPLYDPRPQHHDNAWTHDEIRQLVSYAAARHIDLIPCVELYGHLHDLLRDQGQASLAAMPHGGELNPAEPQTQHLVDAWLKQLAALFPSPWIHIGFDEPFELDHMKAENRRQIPPDQLWSQHLEKTAESAIKLGKYPLFWADIDEGAFLFNKYPQLAKQLPEHAITVPWFYAPRAEYSSLLSAFRGHSIALMVAPGISDWDDIFPDYEATFVNIEGMMRDGRKQNTLGMINTIWSDSAMALHRTASPGIAFGATVAWQSKSVDKASFFALYAQSEYSDKANADKITTAYSNLSKAESLLKVALGEQPIFRIFDDPFVKGNLQRETAGYGSLQRARLHIEEALRALDVLREHGVENSETITLLSQARSMDYLALKSLYAVEINQNINQLPAHPSADDIDFLLGRETAARNHSRISDLIDLSGECSASFTQAWLAESLPYRLSSAQARWSTEQQFWVRLQQHIWQIERDFKVGDARPTRSEILDARDSATP